MIERQMFDGRMATLAYIDEDFNPVPKQNAPRIKVIFDDGGVIFLFKSDNTFDEFNPNQERWPKGTPGSRGGKWKGEGDHPGTGYSENAKLVNGVIHTTDVEDAFLALHEDRRVELDQPRGVSVLLDKLARVSEDMIARGEKAPNFNLCNVSVKGTNLFCVGHMGLERIEMPQMSVPETEKFKDYLKGRGYTVKDEEQFASHLRATQNQLNGARVAGIAKRMREKTFSYPELRTVVSDDDYILDGHHRWAAQVGNDSRDGNLTNNTKVPIARVNIKITELLEEARKFTGGKGAKGIGDGKGTQSG